MDKYFWKDKIVAVTGGSGFIGSHFVEELANAGSKVKCLYSNNNSNLKYLKNIRKKIEFIEIDLLNQKELLNVCKNVNTLINCAAKDGNSEYKIKNAATILDTNIRIVSNILNTSLKNNIINTVLVSSAEIYPLTSVSPIKESDDYTTKFDNLENGYVLSKRYSEIMGKMYSKQYKINIFFPRPTNTYGERDKFDNNNRVIPMLIKKIINKEEIEIWGDGKQERSFIYVKDLVWGVLNMIEKNKYKFLNISTNQSITINKLALLISEIVGNKAKVHYKLNKTAGLKKDH
ncbi:epimerase [Candidatus Roizmanbacteria bacterium CG06_land_8_20_14_3_00_34_14]|uniref:Epimerase n=2 Tax=Candidatus Roizmaniibacteriota TaxID=1752723 RepID=A0A2M7AV26_9BACT|nr:MAG: epimerase [Candidatus Roizmanbacteria bacterium CG06_land_8_20_14_3_00_34_14]